ncbi:MAG: glycerol-3-phosphate dehydrogenase/oxidase [Desulfomonilaceae bacterium]|nr:glycerol-3-phosphate dehydrogenase/oxidase [Desulfomonilaceae bacterium]
MRLSHIDPAWDLIVIGGGITGAGVFREAARSGLKVLLLEGRDFSWGTSSRSAKLVHGGLRYLKEGRIRLTLESVRARQRLLAEAPGLVEPLEFLMPVYEGYGPGRWALKAGLSVYDLMAHKRQHKYYRAEEFLQLVPCIRSENLSGGFRFFDAQVDDCRLVLRLINETPANRGTALNYTEVKEIRRFSGGRVDGVTARDAETGTTRELSAHAVINATGAWAERLHPSPEPHRHLRPLRGSHLIFPQAVLPVDRAVSFIHPSDKRPIYAFPWEGAVLFGTTDVDHREDLNEEPAITREEADYLMDSLHFFFPDPRVSLEHCISTFSGIRSVLSEGKLPPSQESREHVVWAADGLVTVTGGKLTTFRKLAWDTLEAVRPFVGGVAVSGKRDRVFSPWPDSPPGSHVDGQEWRRLCGRYGEQAAELVRQSDPGLLTPIPGTRTLWAELPFVAEREQVRHLADLLLRRVRIGLLTPLGGEALLDEIQRLCEPTLSWDTKRWGEERQMYLEMWGKAYSVPGGFPHRREGM